MKQTPKSCRCTQCKNSNRRKEVQVREQRSFRRNSKQLLKLGDEMLTPAYHGTRVG